MQNKFYFMDEKKGVSLVGDEGWANLGTTSNATQDEQFARVAAAFRAYHIKANTVGGMPFTLYKGEDEFDSSSAWQNKVGFLPNPSDLFRINTLSLIATNTAYNLRTKDALGYKTKGLYPAVAYSFTINTNLRTGEAESITRKVGQQSEKFTMDDPRLVRLWRLDHTTEVLPSRNTEAQAIMSSAGQILYADQWIQHFYRSGGIAPTLIAMKGLIDNTQKEEKEKSWSDWLLGVGRSWLRRARIYNAEAMEVKQLGSSVADLKNTDVYRQAMENIAIGAGMPLSMLLSNSANYATAEAEKRTWINNEIAPLVEWMAYEYNRQVFTPLGLRLVFRPETMDEQQEDEVSRASAVSTFMDFFAKCPNFEIFVGTCATFGYELTDDLLSAAQAYYAAKSETPAPVESPTPKSWSPSPNEMREIFLLRKYAIGKWKSKGLVDLDDYIFNLGGLPSEIRSEIQRRLLAAKSDADVSAAFENLATGTRDDSEIRALAEAINRLAESGHG